MENLKTLKCLQLLPTKIKPTFGNMPYQKVFFFLCLLSLPVLLFLKSYHNSFVANQVNATLPLNWYAVFGGTAPANYRGYDYVFYLPLTALAWERLGFKSVVHIIGNRTEWEQSGPLSWILAHLEARRVILIFIETTADKRPTLSQLSRIFTVNMADFPGSPDDYLITSDADLWPLNRDIFAPKLSAKLVLVHPGGSGSFAYNGSVYLMYAMCNIGATVDTWRQIVNEDRVIAYNSETMLQYLEYYYGNNVRGKSLDWYLDQHIVSIRIHHWLKKYGEERVFKVSDAAFRRIDRMNWNADVNASRINQTLFESTFDAHLPLTPFVPSVWDTIKPLLRLMYGEKSWQVDWANDYATGFHKILNEKRSNR